MKHTRETLETLRFKCFARNKGPRCFGETPGGRFVDKWIKFSLPDHLAFPEGNAVFLKEAVNLFNGDHLAKGFSDARKDDVSGSK